MITLLHSVPLRIQPFRLLIPFCAISSPPSCSPRASFAAMSWMDSWSRPSANSKVPAPLYLANEDTPYCHTCGRVMSMNSPSTFSLLPSSHHHHQTLTIITQIRKSRPRSKIMKSSTARIDVDRESQGRLIARLKRLLPHC